LNADRAAAEAHRYVLPLPDWFTRMRRITKPFLLLLVPSALVLMFVPWKTTVVPAVRLQVLDETGKPAAGVRVKQEWQFLGVDPESQLATSVTDSNGFVAFPARAVKISAVRRPRLREKSFAANVRLQLWSFRGHLGLRS
jgi:hypothetical protein